MALWHLWQHNEVSRVGEREGEKALTLGDLAFIEVEGRGPGLCGLTLC